MREPVHSCEEFLLSRRSIRAFRDEDVSVDLILKAIDIARYAPSSGNRQPWEFMIIKSKDRIKELADIHPWARPALGASAVVIVLVNEKQSPVSYIVDGAIAATYLWLALHCLGLGAVWLQTLRNTNKLREILSIPQEYLPVAILAIGYPAEKPKTKPRKSLEELVHVEEFGNKLLKKNLSKR